MEFMELSESSRVAQERHAEVLLRVRIFVCRPLLRLVTLLHRCEFGTDGFDWRQLDLERRARSVAAPTDPEQVKLKLRELGKPICLFGEDVSRRGWAQIPLQAETLMDLLAGCRSPRSSEVSARATANWSR